MSETKGATMSETAVERRLREMVARQEVQLGGGKVYRPQQADDIDAGREAIALLRTADMYSGGWRLRRRALLARCEGE